MQVDVTLVIPQISGNPNINGKTAVIIDALRATSTMVTALYRGALEVIPVLEPAEAVELAKNIGSTECLVGGERKGIKVEGFHLGNSPLEYTEETIAKKKIVLCTTNGTKAVKLAAQNASEVLIASFLNLGTVAQSLIANGLDFTIVCAGRGNWGVSLEDLACAGWMIDAVAQSGSALTVTDGAQTALYAFEDAKKAGLEAYFRRTDNGKNLVSIGLEADLAACAALNSMPVLPKYQNGRVIL